MRNIIIYILLFVPFSGVQAAYRNGEILIISSYSPDTRRIQEFVTNFSDRLKNDSLDYSFFIESMNIGSVSEIDKWTAKLNSILKKYEDHKIKAIILIGQEAWSASISGGQLPKGTPVFSVNASINGLLLTDIKRDSDGNLNPKSVNMKALAIEKHKLHGGCLYDFNIHSNIELIRNLFPNVSNVVFVSDNTYGGISLKAFMKDSEDNYPDLTFTYIDARDGESRAIDAVKKLSSKTSAIILATWRVDGNDRHMMHNSLDNILKYNKAIPVISLSGIGIGTTAIGGYIPKYSENGTEIAEQIINIYALKDTLKVNFRLLENYYRFNEEIMENYGVLDYKLPKGSTIYFSTEEKVQKYKGYINIIVVVTLIIFIAFVLTILLLRRNIVLKHNLQKREYELIVAKDKAEESDRLKSGFLANMSHEIRTPLNAIIGFSSIISEQENPTENNKACQQIISENSELLLSLINDILDLSRLEFGDFKFDMSDVNVHDLCNSAMYSTSFTRNSKVKGILDTSDKNCIIYTDYKRIMQVLNNLLSNANKFTESGYIKLSYSINSGEEKVYFYIEDTGCGIPIEKQDQIFNRFEKADNFKQGAGLGLSICKNILHRLNTDLWIDSSYTGGARFIFSHEIKKTVNKNVK